MDFFNDIFHNLALLEFYFLNIIYILLYIDFILSIFFQHSNILTRASHHWCLASNIVLVNTLRLKQNDPHFQDIFKCIFLNENVRILLKISLKFVTKVRINNIPALVQILAWCLPGDKPLSEPMMVKSTDAYMSPDFSELRWNTSESLLCISGSFGLYFNS